MNCREEKGFLPASIACAQGVIAGHARLPIILTIHDFVSAADDGQAALSGNGQGFSGLMGDVRISARALNPAEFLTAYIQ